MQEGWIRHKKQKVRDGPTSTCSAEPSKLPNEENNFFDPVGKQVIFALPSRPIPFSEWLYCYGLPVWGCLNHSDSAMAGNGGADMVDWQAYSLWEFVSNCP